MTREYFFIDDSWVYSVCDCCEPIEMECYNINLDEHPDFYQNGSALTVEDCWRDVLLYEGLIDEEDELEYHELFRLMEKYSIYVYIE